MPGYQRQVCSGEAPARAQPAHVCPLRGRGALMARQPGGPRGGGADAGVACAWEKRGGGGGPSGTDGVVAEAQGKGRLRRFQFLVSGVRPGEGLGE